jgi:glutamine cyclotransferase
LLRDMLRKSENPCVFDLSKHLTMHSLGGSRRIHVVVLLTVTAILIIGVALMALLNGEPVNSSRPLSDCNLLSTTTLSELPSSSQASTPSYCTYEVVNVYPHSEDAFTEGLVFDSGFFYESTGLYGKSSLRRVELETGNILKIYSLRNQLFGEGMTIFNNKIIQLTWQSHIGFVYDKDTFDLLRNFSYPTEGWGLTNDGRRLIMSDGTPNLYFLDPQNFQNTGLIEVRDGTVPVINLNELEYINGNIYANVWLTNRIAVIDPQSGQVKAWIDLTGIEETASSDANNVLNGIAYDSENNHLFVTGKEWPRVFEITLVPQLSPH